MTSRTETAGGRSGTGRRCAGRRQLSDAATVSPSRARDALHLRERQVHRELHDHLRRIEARLFGGSQLSKSPSDASAGMAARRRRSSWRGGVPGGALAGCAGRRRGVEIGQLDQRAVRLRRVDHELLIEQVRDRQHFVGDQGLAAAPRMPSWKITHRTSSQFGKNVGRRQRCSRRSRPLAGRSRRWNWRACRPGSSRTRSDPPGN